MVSPAFRGGALVGNLFEELKRRNVFRVGAAYLVVGWVLAQVGDLAADNLAFPDWFMPMVLVVLALGFPVALFFAWAFELTPEGVKKTEDVAEDESVTTATGQKLNYVIIGALVLALGYFVWERQNLSPEAPQIRRLPRPRRKPGHRPPSLSCPLSI